MKYFAFAPLVALLGLMSVLSLPVEAKTFKIATVSPDGLDWMKKLRAGAKEIKKVTEGRVVFKVYPGGVQGDDYTVLRKMRIRQLHGGAVAASVLTRFYPDLQVYNLPLQFRSADEVDHVRKEMDQTIVDGLEDNGMVTFGLTETGFAYLLSKKPIHSVEDLQDVKAWVPDGDPISANIVQSFGISPIPLPITDVLAGLQTGLIDTVAVPPIVALALQWHNQVKYVTNMPLVYIYSMLAMDKKAFSSISDADQKTVKTIFNKVFADVDAANRIDNVKAYEALLSQGIKAVSPNAEQIAEWRERAEISIDKLVNSGQMSPEVLVQLREQLSVVRGGDENKTKEVSTIVGQ